ncbi:hypothetical protein F0A17_07325 [Billgrantia pellis]|uniref:Uncharacterized protein n=1 Tax=Billgrantia pellis TaxID=2606936 RepID=A0A7V7G089_9GAMM|nr:hypothetical protein F0A17_07325 [Halomonas pellis]
MPAHGNRESPRDRDGPGKRADRHRPRSRLRERAGRVRSRRLDGRRDGQGRLRPVGSGRRRPAASSRWRSSPSGYPSR